METKPHLIIAHKNFAANANVSHIGLGVSAMNNQRVLSAHGVRVDVKPITSSADLVAVLDKSPTVTHCVISAPWIPVSELAAIVHSHPLVQFSVNCHSNVAFLQADTRGVHLIRQYIDLDQGSVNFTISANSAKCVRWIRTAYQTTCAYLPNMYFLDYSCSRHRPLFNGGVLKIAAFGATRPQKNLMTAAGAALALSQVLKVDTEFWVNVGRSEGGGGTILNAIREMLNGVPGITLKEYVWSSWPSFRDTVRRMHLMLQPSNSESFNFVSGDAVAEGVPVVGSEAISWLPDRWKANADDALDVAEIGRRLISDPEAAHQGLIALEQHNADSFQAWTKFLDYPIIYKSVFNDPYLL